MKTEKPMQLKLEIDRATLLYKQNYPGVAALLVYSVSYFYFCRDILSKPLLIFWVSLVIGSSILRLWSSWHWFKIDKSKITMAQIKFWRNFIHAMLGISGIVWGIAGWMARYSENSTQQIVASMTVSFMAAGAVASYSVSLPAFLLVAIPALLPWSLGLLFTGNSNLEIMGVMVFLYMLIGTKIGVGLNHYVVNSLKLTIENATLSSELKQEIAVKKQAEEALQLALSASEAMGWSWNRIDDIFKCDGDLSHSLGINARSFTGSLNDFLKLIVPEDQNFLRLQMMDVSPASENLDTDVRVQWADGQIRDMALRGRLILDSESNVSTLTGIAWNATLKKSQEKLQRERDIHEAANNAKSMFLANASHEMRTPLAAIEGYTEALRHSFNQPEFDNQKIQTDLTAISRNGKYLISLMNDFLDLSKIETSHYYIQKSTVNLQNEINESVLMVKAAIEEKGLKILLSFAPNIPEYIETDPMRFRQVLVNLLSNSIKFTQYGSISLSVFQKGNQLVINTKDTGLGMDTTTQGHLFEPFIRGSSAEVQKVKGSGLGLALSRNLTRLLGGNLRLVSSAIGKGTEFELTIPIGSPMTLQQNPTPQQSTQEFVLSKAKILVVDDDDDLRELMQRFLERYGATVEVGVNGEEAVRMASEQNFDIILMDMKMPVLDGYQATKTLRENSYQKTIIAVTAHANSEDKLKSLNAGCDFYMSKPVDFAGMLSLLTNALKERQVGSV